ncbi:MAG TPA: hypothetical protein VFQ25_03995 [Ktedonobacterales bacterium]|nr:hypothetical protein [Ktedonobacterales bacterium]
MSASMGKGRYLLMVACSQRKTSSTRPCPAIERYDGVNYRVLRNLKRQGLWPENLDIVIISAKFGLLDASAPIENYDLRMTRDRALALQRDVSAGLDARLRQTDYVEVFVNVGATYRLALEQSGELRRLGGRARYASGGIGIKMGEMRRWILHLVEDQTRRSE